MTLNSLLLVLGALAGVLALVLAAQRLALGLGLAQRVPAATGGRIAVVQVLALDPRRRLLLVRCDNRQLLLLTGGAQDVVVGWLEPPAP